MCFKTAKCCLVVESGKGGSDRGEESTRYVPEVKVFDPEFRILDLDFTIYAGYLIDTIVDSGLLEFDLQYASAPSPRGKSRGLTSSSRLPFSLLNLP